MSLWVWFLDRENKFTVIIFLTTAVVSSPIFTICHFIGWRWGIFSDSWRWVNSRSLWNEGWSTSENGWSHVTIHSARSCSNVSWSQLASCNILSIIHQKQTNLNKRVYTTACWFCLENASTRLVEDFSSLTKYSTALVGSSILLLEAMAISSIVGGS